MKTALSGKASIGIAAAAAAGLVGLAPPAAANAATMARTLHATSTAGTQSQASACFQALDSAAVDLSSAGYDVVEFGPWMTDVQEAQTGMHNPVCAPLAAQIQGPIAQAESLTAQAVTEANAGDTTDASNTFQSASNALAPAWWAVYLISFRKA